MRQRPIAIVLIGLPSSGKSTLAQEMASSDANSEIIERDIAREEIGNGSRKEFYNSPAKPMLNGFSLESIVSDVCLDRLRACSKHGKSVIVSDTNTNRRNRHMLYRTLFDLGFRVGVYLVDTDVETCIQRNLERDPDKQVPEHVIHRMSAALEKDRELINSEIEILNTEYTASITSGTMVFDIDGTLAAMNDRSPFEWHKVGQDFPRKTVIQLCRFYIENEYPVMFFSGRDGVCRTKTLKWLQDNVHSSIIDSQLMMRQAGDQRVDWIVKGEIMREYVRQCDGIPPTLCVDDRQQVVDVWRNMGIQTWQVDTGRF